MHEADTWTNKLVSVLPSLSLIDTTRLVLMNLKCVSDLAKFCMPCLINEMHLSVWCSGIGIKYVSFLHPLPQGHGS